MKPLNLEEISTLLKNILSNAEELLEESEILLEHKKHTRAFTLTHLAAEEIFKLPALLTAASDTYRGKVVKWKKLDKRMRDHKMKIRSNLIFERMISNPKEFPNFEDIKKQAEKLNELKNNSLYAGFHKGKFIKPSDIICKEETELLLNRTKFYLALIKSSPHIRDGDLIGLFKKPSYQKMVQTMIDPLREN